MFIILTLSFIVITIVFNFYWNTYTYWERRGVPHDKPLPIVGNLRGIGVSRHFRDVYRTLYNKYKDQAQFAGLFVFFKRSALIFDLELIKQIFIKDFSNFENRGLYINVEDEPLSGHLLLLENDEWKEMRQKLTPVFTSGKLRHVVPAIAEVCERLVTAMDVELNKPGKDADILEIKELSARFTTDVIGVCVFGLECNSLQDPNAEFRQMGLKALTTPRHHPLIQLLILTNPEISRKLHLKVLPDFINEFFTNVVRNTVQYRLENSIKRNDFIDMLLEMKAPDLEAKTPNGGIDLSKGLTLLQMAAQLFGFFFAGFETSSSTMTFALYELAQRQDIQQFLREEILARLKAHKGILSYEAITEMTFLDQVVAETLRLYPVLPQLQRKVNSDYKVPNSKLVIERGTIVIIPVEAIHHDPAIYPNPEVFDPKRFDPEAIKSRHNCAYLPFGDGPRNCIGSRFGKLQTKMGLITFLRHYKFSVSYQTEIPFELNNETIMISPKNGVHLKVERVQD